jgi:phage baseplate assembly protein W
MPNTQTQVRGRDLRGIAYPIDKGREGYWSRKNSGALTQTAIQMILSTTPGERVGLPEFGSRLKELIFEPNDDALARAISQETAGAIERFYPYVSVVSVTTEASDNQVTIYIDYVELLDERQDVRRVDVSLPR